MANWVEKNPNTYSELTLKPCHLFDSVRAISNPIANPTNNEAMSPMTHHLRINGSCHHVQQMKMVQRDKRTKRFGRCASIPGVGIKWAEFLCKHVSIIRANMIACQLPEPRGSLTLWSQKWLWWRWTIPVSNWILHCWRWWQKWKQIGRAAAVDVEELACRGQPKTLLNMMLRMYRLCVLSSLRAEIVAWHIHCAARAVDFSIHSLARRHILKTARIPPV